jgi:hypothetical protein
MARPKKTPATNGTPSILETASTAIQTAYKLFVAKPNTTNRVALNDAIDAYTQAFIAEFISAPTPAEQVPEETTPAEQVPAAV